MRSFIKFLQLSADEKNLFFKAFFLLLICRIRVQFSSTQSIVSKAYSQTYKEISSQTNPLPLERIIWIINRVSRLVPSTCLSKSLAGQILLAQHDYRTELHVGVAKDNMQRLEAHSWLTKDGEIILGYLEDINRFQEFPLNQLANKK